MNLIRPIEISKKWKCEMFGSGPNGIVYTPPVGNEPNLFWRYMQYLCFGHKWVYTEDNND